MKYLDIEFVHANRHKHTIKSDLTFVFIMALGTGLCYIMNMMFYTGLLFTMALYGILDYFHILLTIYKHEKKEKKK